MDKRFAATTVIVLGILVTSYLGAKERPEPEIPDSSAGEEQPDITRGGPLGEIERLLAEPRSSRGSATTVTTTGKRSIERRPLAKGECSPESRLVSAAYGAIPHEQTTYSSAESKESPALASDLRCVLGLVDSAIVEKVRAQQALSAGKASSFDSRIEPIIANLRMFSRDARLGKPVTEIIEGLEGQRAFLREWGGSGSRTPDIARNPHVLRSSGHLKKAYGHLMSAFPKETSRNKKAFYDHLCALDFI